MLAQCPQCATKVQVDDAKVPDRPFRVRCPRCQATISLPGRAAADVPPPVPEPTAEPPAPEPAAPPSGPPAPSPIAEAAMSAATAARRERLAEGQNDAVIALSGPAAAHVQGALERLGFRVDTVEDVEEGARLLEQGVYELAVTAREIAEAGKPETLAQRILRLTPDARRRVFVVYVGDAFRSGDGTQAWAAQGDLVLSPADAPRCENLIRSTLAERKRLYQPFLDARRRIETD